MARLRSALANLGLIGLSLGLCAVVVEIAARAVVARAAPAPEGPHRPISRYHPKLGWDKPPGGEQRIAREEYDVVVRINSKGLRGPELDYAKPAGTRRVLILGDSFGEGYYVAEEASARAVLESLLKTGSTCRYEVVNGATAGYSTDQEYLSFEEEAYKYAPDLVTVFFYYNDLYYNTTGVGTGGKPKPRFDAEGNRLILRNVPVPRPTGDEQTSVGAPRPWRGSVALRLLSDRTAASPRLHAGLARLGLVEPRSGEPFREFWPWGLSHQAEVDEMWRRTAVILKALKESVESRGGRLAVLYVPARFEVNEDALGVADRQMGVRRTRERIVTRLKATCGAIGIPLVDPREALRRTESAGNRAYFPKDGHWNEAGNAIIAHALLPVAKQLAPCPTP